MCIINENKIDVQPSTTQLKVYKSIKVCGSWSRYYYMEDTQRAMNIQTFL